MASFRKIKNKWQYRVTYYDTQGKRKEISKSGFLTKAEAKAAADKVEYEIGLGMEVDKGNMPFIDYYKHWVKIYKSGVYSDNTDYFYDFATRLIADFFGNKKLKDITRDDYQMFLNDYAEGRAKSTVKKMHTKIGASLRDAFHSGYIAINPAYNPSFRGHEEQPSNEKYLNEDEAGKLIQALLKGIRPSYTSRYMLLLQLASGMRISEVMALQFDDVDFLHGKITVNKSWDYTYTNDFKSTKNKESRIITIDRETLKILRECFNYQKSQKIISHKNLLFAKGEKVPSFVAINKTLKKACQRAGIPVITSHALRHTHASILLSKGIPLPYISKRLGHKSISITSDVYAHVIKEMEQKSERESALTFAQMY